MKIRFILSLCFIVQIFMGTGQSQTDVFFLGHQYGIGARAMSMGGAFSAVADDYTASYWNPAGLAQIRRMEMLGAMSHLMYKNEASTADISYIDETNATKLNALGFVFPYPTYRGSLVFALGYNRIRSFDNGFYFDGLFFANTDTVFQEENTEIEDGGLTNWVVAGAIDVTINMSVGVSMNVWRGNNDFEKIVAFDDLTNTYYYDYDAQFNIKTDYSGINFMLGALYRIGKLGRVAASMTTPLTLHAEENIAYDQYWSHPVAVPDSAYDSFPNKYKIKAPFIFRVGGAFTLFPNLTIAGDLEFSDWSQLKFENESSNVIDPRSDVLYKRVYKATQQIHLGAEFTVPLINLQLRAGYFNKPSPLKDESVGDKQYLTAGVGMLLDKQVKLDLAWIKGWWKSESNLYYGSAPLNEEIKVDNILATLAIRF